MELCFVNFFIFAEFFYLSRTAERKKFTREHKTRAVFTTASQRRIIINMHYYKFCLRIRRNGMNMKKFVKGLSAVLCLVFALSLLGCSKMRPIKSKEGELDVVGNIGRFEVYYEELRYITVNCKNDMEIIYGMKIWDDPATAEQYRDELYERVTLGIVSDYYGVLSLADLLYSESGGADAMLESAEIQNAVQDSIDETVDEAGGKSEYRKVLEDNALTDHLFRFYTAIEMVANELFFIARDDLGLLDDSDEYADEYMHSDKFIRTNHVYLEGKTAENRQLAESIATQLKNSDNPEAELILLKGRYCADWKMTTTHAYYFARGNSGCGESYEDTAFALKVGEISDVIESDTGYYVIMRLPKEEDYMKECFDDFKTQIIGTDFNDSIEAKRAEMTFTANEYGASIDLVSLT